jgi:hypothetical protein
MRELSTEICAYIFKEWIAPWKGSIRSLATELDIDEKTLRQIKEYRIKSYKPSLYSIEKICRAKEISLEKFFRLIGR